MTSVLDLGLGFGAEEQLCSGYDLFMGSSSDKPRTDLFGSWFDRLASFFQA